MKGRLPDKIRLEHIRDALSDINTFIYGLEFDDFATDTKTKLAVVKALEIVGEAANHLENTTRQLDVTIDWTAIIALRHILVHEYYGIRSEIIWRIITVHTIDLAPKIEALIKTLSE